MMGLNAKPCMPPSHNDPGDESEKVAEEERRSKADAGLPIALRSSVDFGIVNRFWAQAFGFNQGQTKFVRFHGFKFAGSLRHGLKSAPATR